MSKSCLSLFLGLIAIIFTNVAARLVCTSYLDNGKTYAHAYDCSLYLQCSNGIVLTRHCPKGTVFNPRLRVCVYKNSPLDPCRRHRKQRIQKKPNSGSCVPFDNYYHSPAKLLPSDLKPLHYDVELTPVLNKLKSHFGGRVQIKFRVEKRTKEIYLNSGDLSIMGKATLKSTNCSVPLVTGMEEVEDRIVVALDDYLPEGCEYSTDVRFSGGIGGRTAGIVRRVLDADDAKGESLISNMDDGQAKRLFPSFDDVGVATYRLMVGDREEMTTVSNMPMLKDKNRMSEFQTTPPLNLDQLAFFQGHFHSMEKETGKVKVRVLSKQRDVAGLHLVLEETVVYVDVFTDYFGQPLPINKIDYLAVPGPDPEDLTLPGIILRRPDDMMSDKMEADMQIQQNAALAIAKSIAKQWTEGSIHPASMGVSAWIQTGLAHYLAHKAVRVHHPHMAMTENLEYTDIERALELEASSISHSLNLQSRDPRNYHRVSHDQLTTFKGAALMRMIEGIIGGTKFRGAIQEFFTNYKHKTFELEDFKHTMVKVSGIEEVGGMMDAYSTYQGVPIISVVMETGNIVRISQRDLSEDFSSLTAEVNSSFSHTYIFDSSLPVTIITSDTPDNHHISWVGPRDHVDVPLSSNSAEDGWILANQNRMGYYIVEYDETNWQKLIHQLLSNHEVFTPATRSQLIFDSTYLFSIGRLPATIPLDLLCYLRKETDLGPWTSAIRALDYWRLILRGTPAGTYLKSFVHHLLTDIYNNYRMGVNNADPSFRQRQAVIVYAACSWDVEGCLYDAVAVFSGLLQTGTFSINTTSDMRETVYCVGIQHKLVGAWDYVKHHYFTTHDNREKQVLLNAMGCSPDEQTIARYLHLGLDKRLHRSHVPQLIANTARNICSNRLAWTFVKLHFDELRCLWFCNNNVWCDNRNSYGWNTIPSEFCPLPMLPHWFRDKPYILDDIIIQATSRFSKSFEYYEIRTFLERQQNIDQSREALQTILNLIGRRSRVIIPNYNIISDWLQTSLLTLDLESVESEL